jgi:hypothetical protein
VLKLKKYIVFPAAILLVLSNFSFATQQMLCLMTEDESETELTCTCVCDEEQAPSGITLSSESTPCCQNKTMELNNSNNLQVSASHLLKDVTAFSPTILITHVEDLSAPSKYSFIVFTKEHVPRTDLPVILSSLLI